MTKIDSTPQTEHSDLLAAEDFPQLVRDSFCRIDTHCMKQEFRRIIAQRQSPDDVAARVLLGEESVNYFITLLK